MRVRELWRFPVKSLMGERLESASCRPGLVGDRQYAIFDVETGFGLTGRRVPELLFASSKLREDGGVDITLPDGSLARDNDALSDWLGRRVVLRSADERIAAALRERRRLRARGREREWARSAARPARSTTREARACRWCRRRRSARGTARRFRVERGPRRGGRGRTGRLEVALGDAEIDMRKQIARCVMTTRAQAGGIERDLDVLRTIARERDACLAVGALVARGGVCASATSSSPPPERGSSDARFGARAAALHASANGLPDDHERRSASAPSSILAECRYQRS